jgi:hypothetical protein
LPEGNARIVSPDAARFSDDGAELAASAVTGTFSRKTFLDRFFRFWLALPDEKKHLVYIFQQIVH